MLLSRVWRPAWSKAVIPSSPHKISHRCFTILGIETSCDDTSVCLLSLDHISGIEKVPLSGSGTSSSYHDTVPKARILFHETITSDNRIYGGIHPVISLRSHRANLATLIQRCLHDANTSGSLTPDLIAVTRGPGMTSSVDVGLATAKGLAIAFRRPLVGVNHMQAHALTMRLVNAMQTSTSIKQNVSKDFDDHKPDFPYLSLLISGGHTLLVLSTSLTDYRILVDPLNIAIGDAVDKCARSILPRDVTSSSEKYVKNVAAAESRTPQELGKVTPSNDINNTIAYGKLLESFVFPDKNPDYAEALLKVPGGSGKRSVDGRRIVLPLTGANDSTHIKLMKFSFSSFPSNVDNVLQNHWDKVLSQDDIIERRKLGLEVMTRMFYHLTDRVRMGVELLEEEGIKIKDLVVSGGVASNGYMRYLLQKSFLPPVVSDETTTAAKALVKKKSTNTARKSRKPKPLPTLNIHFPPINLCTDNAAMIAWAGWEMYNAGWETELNVQPFKKWSLEEKRDEEEEKTPKDRRVSATGKLDEKVNRHADLDKKSEDGWGILTVAGWKRRERHRVTPERLE